MRAGKGCVQSKILAECGWLSSRSARGRGDRFYYPRTATGQSSLLPAPPWHYSGDLLTVEYRTDPALVAELLPAAALAPEDPGAIALIWADWRSCGDDRAELLDPVGQYRECFAVARCSYGGTVCSRCLYLGRRRLRAGPRPGPGLPEEARLGAPDEAAPLRAGRAADRAGGVFAGDAGGADRSAGPGGEYARCEEAPSSGFVNAHPMAHHRWMPSVAKGAPDSLAELIVSGSASPQAGPAWRGDATLELFESPTEELARLEVREIVAATTARWA